MMNLRNTALAAVLVTALAAPAFAADHGAKATMDNATVASEKMKHEGHEMKKEMEDHAHDKKEEKTKAVKEEMKKAY